MSILNSPLLEAKKIRKTYRKKGLAEIDVIQEVDLTLYPKERIAILGKSGAGKSTLLHILGTLDRPTSGEVYFEGQALSALSDKALCALRNKEVGFVFQFHYLMLEFTALENVMMPALLGNISFKRAKERAEALLTKVGLKQRIQHKPNELSGGESQRVAIARALMMNPKILLTDEMTGNLDSATGLQVFQLLLAIQEEFGVTLVSVTHDENLASFYSRIYRLDAGELKVVR